MSMIVRVKVVLNRTIVGITSVDVIKLWLLVIILNLLMTPGFKPFTLTYLVDVFIVSPNFINNKWTDLSILKIC